MKRDSKKNGSFERRERSMKPKPSLFAFAGTGERTPLALFFTLGEPDNGVRSPLLMRLRSWNGLFFWSFNNLEDRKIVGTIGASIGVQEA